MTSRLNISKFLSQSNTRCQSEISLMLLTNILGHFVFISLFHIQRRISSGSVKTPLHSRKISSVFDKSKPAELCGTRTRALFDYFMLYLILPA